ncbi:hypothetical protein FSARC_13346 [Fusarium sarcochroum]|uniref:Uncharacterized protein n=1 Tax=Fusarium sarcochroum TaxID=1208366 RepID=A0A8H4WTN4_9HYPO|nr:hypothetical protein FSARC_13346 [Fusarium sarcochroum]
MPMKWETELLPKIHPFTSWEQLDAWVKIKVVKDKEIWEKKKALRKAQNEAHLATLEEQSEKRIKTVMKIQIKISQKTSKLEEEEGADAMELDIGLGIA